jgi:hypothetical protein
MVMQVAFGVVGSQFALTGLHCKKSTTTKASVEAAIVIMLPYSSHFSHFVVAPKPRKKSKTEILAKQRLNRSRNSPRKSILSDVIISGTSRYPACLPTPCIAPTTVNGRFVAAVTYCWWSDE